MKLLEYIFFICKTETKKEKNFKEKNMNEQQLLSPMKRLSDHTAARVQATKSPSKFTVAKGNVRFIWGESCCGQKKDGPQTAPPLVCDAAFLDLVRDMGWEPSISRSHQVFKPSPVIEDERVSHLHEPFCVAETCDLVARQVSQAHADGAFPILIGGDHCLALGSVKATAQAFPKVIVVWFDAHADINTPETSPSGNIHGMPLAGIIGLPGMNVSAFHNGRFACIQPHQVVWIGLRDVDDGEMKTLAELNVKKNAYFMSDVNRLGMRKIISQIIHDMNPNLDIPMHISFDVDGMDPMDAPSTGTPVVGGVRIHEALELVDALRETGCLVSFDCVEVNPSLGSQKDSEITIANARLVIAHALGNRS